jgi:hypothetical protein
MVDWNKDRNRQLRRRAQLEEYEKNAKEWAPKPGWSPPPRVSKASLRAIGEELVREHMNKRRSV